MEAMYYTDRAERSKQADSIMQIPSHRWVVMCDGHLVQRLVNYDIDKAKEDTERWAQYEKEDMSDIEFYDAEVVKIPYTVDGSAIEGTMAVENYDKDTYKDELKALHEKTGRTSQQDRKYRSADNRAQRYGRDGSSN